MEISTISDSNSHCSYCKKALSPVNDTEYRQGYHDDCLTEYNEYMILKSHFGRSLSDWEYYVAGRGYLNLIRDSYSSFRMKTANESFAVLKRLDQLYLDENKFSTLPSNINEFKNLSTLHLSSNRFSVFPDIFNLKNLTSLEIDNNKLKTIPDSIAKLPKLRYLDLSHNQIEELPASIGTLQNLWELNLSHNKIEKLPSSIGSLTNLRELNVSSNQLSELPVELNQLTSLTSLNASDNNITKLSVDNIPNNIRVLDFHYNNIKSLPAIDIKPPNINFDFNPLQNIPDNWFIDNKSNELSLYFRNCDLSSIPDSLSTFNLFALSLPNNNISTLPPDLGQDRYIDNIDLSNNPISQLPDHLLERSRNIVLNNTKIQFLPELGSTTKQLLLKNTPISDFPDLKNIKEMDYFDIQGTAIEYIPSYVKDIVIYDVYISDSNLKRYFNSECRIHINEDSDYDLTTGSFHWYDWLNN